MQTETFAPTTLSATSENKSKSAATPENTVFVMSEYGVRVKLLIQTDTLLEDGGTLIIEVGGQIFTSTINGDKKPNEGAKVIDEDGKPVDSGYGITFTREDDLNKLNTQDAKTPKITYTPPGTSELTNKDEIKIDSLTTVEVTAQNTVFDEKNISLDYADDSNNVSFDNTVDTAMVVYVEPSDGYEISEVTYEIINNNNKAIPIEDQGPSSYGFIVPAGTKVGVLQISVTQTKIGIIEPRVNPVVVDYTLDPKALANVGGTYIIATRELVYDEFGEDDTVVIFSPMITTDAELIKLTAKLNIYDRDGNIPTEVSEGIPLTVDEWLIPTIEQPWNPWLARTFIKEDIPDKIFTEFTTTLTLDWTDETGHTVIEINPDGTLAGSSKDNGLSGWAIAGIVIGSLVTVGLISGGGYYFYTTKKLNRFIH